MHHSSFSQHQSQPSISHLICLIISTSAAMHLLLSLLALAPFIFANPAPAPQSDTTPPTTSTTRLYVCSDASWGGTCNNLELTVSDYRTSSIPVVSLHAHCLNT
jgi:hypothetical protein